MIAKPIGPVAFAFTQSGFLLPATLAVSTPKITQTGMQAKVTLTSMMTPLMMSWHRGP